MSLLFTGMSIFTLRHAAERWTEGLEGQKENNRTHDIGFMTFCSFGNGYRLTGNPQYKAVLLQAAQTLSTRFNSTIGCIKSWDGQKAWRYPVIIDTMMNLELLFWGSKNGGAYWDFDAPGIPHAPRDASASAIAAAALIELGTQARDPDRQAKYLSAAQRILTTLCSSAYLAEGTGSAGFLNHGVGNMPAQGEVDVFLVYADYYFVEALLRYRALHPR